MKKLILSLCVLFSMSVANVFADEQVTIDLSSKYDTQQNVALSEETFGDVTLTFAQGTGEQAPIYYYNHFRIYEGNTLTITAAGGKKIVSVLFNYAAKKSLDNPTISPDAYQYDADSRTITGSDSESITIIVTNAQSRVSSMVVTLNDGGEAAAEPDEFNLAASDCGIETTDDALTLTGANSTIVWTQGDNTTGNSTYNTNHVRFFANGIMTISSEKYNIASVEFKYVTGRDPKTRNAVYTITPEAYTYDYDTNILSGSGSKSITVSTSAQVRINYIKITFEGGSDPSDAIEIHDNYVLMPTVKVASFDELPESKHPNYIYYINAGSAIGEEPTSTNIVLVGGASTVSYAITINDGYPFENIMSFHCAAWYEHTYTQQLNTVCLPIAVPIPDQTANEMSVCTFEGATDDAFSFTQVEEIVENMPYLIYAQAQADTTTIFDAGYGVRNVPVTPSEPKSVAVGDYKFVGTTLGVAAEQMTSGTYYVLKGDEWVKTTEAITPLTAYIYTEKTDAPDVMKVQVNGQVLTGISETVNRQLSTVNCEIYSLDGKCMGTKEASLNPGLYIRDGKKYIKQ